MILVCVSWLSETPGQGNAAIHNSSWVFFFFFARRKKKTQIHTKTGKEMNSVCVFLVWDLRVASGTNSQLWGGFRSLSHRRVAKAGKQPRRDPGKRLTPH